jgi:hypothetical protein
LIKDWHSYLKAGEANILPGDVIDWFLHQKTLVPAGPDEYFDRAKKSIDSIYNNCAAGGVFIHDLHRALFNKRRNGPYPTIEWMLNSARIITYSRKKHGLNALDCTISIKGGVCAFRVKNADPARIKSASLRIYTNPELTCGVPAVQDIDFKGQSELVIEAPYVIKSHVPERAENHYIAARIEYADGSKQRSITEVYYFRKRTADGHMIAQAKQPEKDKSIPVPSTTTYENAE